MAEPSEEQVDEAYDVMSAELDHWDVVGPAKDGHFVARRFDIVQQRHAPPSAIILPNQPLPEEAGVRIIHFKDKAHAIACVQWHSLQAVLRHFKIEG